MSRFEPISVTRRGFLSAAGAFAGAVGVAGCGSGSLGAAGSRSAGSPLTYSGVMDKSWTARAQGDIAAFQATNPGFTVKYSGFDERQYQDEALRLAVSGLGPGLLWYWITARFQDVVASHAALDLSDVWAGSMKDVRPATVDWYRDSGAKHYAVPLDIGFYPILFYNKSIFGRLGVAPPPADTRAWSEDELFHACKTFRRAGLIPWALPGNSLSAHVAEAIAVSSMPQDVLQHYTVEAWKPGSEYQYTDAAWRNVFDTVDRWSRHKVFEPKSGDVNQIQAHDLFVQGKAAMVSGGAWTIADLKSTPGAPDFDWMLFPSVSEPSKLLVYVGTGAFISAAAATRDEAKEFLKFMLRPERLMVAAQKYNQIPGVNLPGLDEVLDPRVAAMVEFSQRNGITGVNWATEIDVAFGAAAKGVIAGTTTADQAVNDMEIAGRQSRARLQ